MSSYQKKEEWMLLTKTTKYLSYGMQNTTVPLEKGDGPEAPTLSSSSPACHSPVPWRQWF